MVTYTTLIFVIDGDPSPSERRLLRQQLLVKSPAVVEVHPAPALRWGGRMLPADWSVERLAEAGCHSGLDRVQEPRAGTALVRDLLQGGREGGKSFTGR